MSSPLPQASSSSSTSELDVTRLEKQLGRQLRRTSEAHELLKEGDRIMVAVSGGKDSYTLFELLHQLKRRLPFKVELIAVHLDQAQPGYDGKPLAEYLEKFGQPYEILREDTYSVVLENTKQGGTYCSLCSRLRRGILYRAAERLKCNKIALGHHRDDALETFMMNLFYAGKMQSMPARYLTDDGRFEVIRPLIECEEEKIAAYAKRKNYPILPCNLCGSQAGLKRDQMTALLKELEKNNPHVKSVMMSALGNICPTHLFDRDLQRAWSERNPEIPAKASLGQGKAHPTEAWLAAPLPKGQQDEAESKKPGESEQPIASRRSLPLL